MLIRNYGLYWSTDKVFWGYPNVEGTLLGVPRRIKRASATEFREQIAVYVLYQGFDPVYVGQTGSGEARLFRRLRGHRRDHLAGRWDSFSWFGVIPVNPKNRRLRLNYKIAPKLNDVLNHMEATLIAVLEPALNLQRGRFGNAVQYVQKLDNRLPEKLDRQISEMRDQLARIEKAVKVAKD